MDVITERREIERIQGELVPRLANDWALLTAGTAGDWNTMTIAWGTLGDVWWEPVVCCYVVPTRHTYGFMERHEEFTVSFFPNEFHGDLKTLGSLSGRDCDKVARTALTPMEAEESVTFEQADTTLVCRKIYAQPLDPGAVPAFARERFYRDMREHTLFMGRIESVLC